MLLYIFITKRSNPYVQLRLSTFQERTLRTQVSRKAVFENGAASTVVDEYLRLSHLETFKLHERHLNPPFTQICTTANTPLHFIFSLVRMEFCEM
jgi:hypothetical protein